MRKRCALQTLQIIVFCSAVLCFDTAYSNSAFHSPTYASHHNYDVTGDDFMNTRTTKLCLLARLNASIEFFYNVTQDQLEIFVPENATNVHSYCDYNYTSLLQLDFNGLSLSLIFQRDYVKLSETAPVYCNKCDGGHWRLRWMKVKTADVREVMPKVPRTAIVAEAHASDLSEVAGGFISHISLQRGYRCLDQVLSADLKVVDAFDYATSRHTMREWRVVLHLHSIEVQPFLVTNQIVKDPILCKDVTLSVILIITIPIIYFAIFIVIYRLKDKGKLLEWKKKYFSKKSPTKAMLPESTPHGSKPSVKVKKSNPVSVTCTAPDESKERLRELAT